MPADGGLRELENRPQLVHGELVPFEGEQEPAPRGIREGCHLPEKGDRRQTLHPFIRIEGYYESADKSSVFLAGGMRSSRLRCRKAAGDIVGGPNERSFLFLRHMTFEASLRRLNEILAALEEQQVGLDASLKLFEEGVELLRSASAELGRAETKVQMLLEKSDGGFELREMDL